MEISIEVCDSKVLACIPAHYLVDGRLFLDVCGEGNTKKKLNISLGENQIQSENLFSDILDMTALNIAVFGYRPCKEVEVIIRYAECSFRRVAYLVQVEPDAKKYVIQWNRYDWRKKAERTTICDVFDDDDIIIWDQPTIDFLITNEAYTDGALLDSLSSPLDYYGSFRDATQPINIRKEDLRIKINPKIIFEKFFKKCGMSFCSPLYDSYYGSIQSRYLLKKEFWKHDGHGTLSNAGLSMSAPITTGNSNAGEVLPHDTIDSGDGLVIYNAVVNGVNTVVYENTNSIPNTLEFCVSGTITSNAVGGNQITGIGMGILNPGGNFTGSNYPLGFLKPINQGETSDYSIKQKITIQPGERLTPIVVLPNSATFQQSIKIKNCNKFFNEGDVIRLNQVFDCDKTVADIIEAESQLFNFIPNQSQDESEVCFDIPYDVTIGAGTVQEEVVRGYFGQKNSAIKIPGTKCGKDILRCGTVNLLKRRYKFCFASSSDAAVAAVIESGDVTSDPENSCEDLEKVEGQFIKSIDNLFGISVINDVNNSEKKEYCNKCYEPSVMERVPTGLEDFENNNISHYSSHHYEEDNGLCVGARSTVNYLGTQFDNGLQLKVTFEGNILNEFLVSYQAVPLNIELEREYNLTFDVAGENLFSLFYAKYFRLLTGGLEFITKRNMNPIEFKSLDVSKYYCVDYEGGELIIRILSTNIKDGNVNLQAVVESDC